VFCTCADKASVLVESASFDVTSLSEGVTVQDLEKLQTNLPKCLTDTLFKKLLDLEEVREYI